MEEKLSFRNELGAMSMIQVRNAETLDQSQESGDRKEGPTLRETSDRVRWLEGL